VLESRKSLQRTLLTWMLPPLMVVVAAGAATQYALTAEPAVESLDHALYDVVIVLGQMIQWQDGRARFSITPETETAIRTDELDTVYFAVLDPERRLIGGDAALGQLQIAAPLEEFVGVDQGVDGRAVRVVARRIECGPRDAGYCEVRVGETLVKRRRIQHKALIGSAISLTLVAIATVACVYFALSLALRPLRQLTGQIAHRSLDDLREVTIADAPREVAPLLAAINRLFVRVQQGAMAQREFLANAAHQLRTPLTALHTEAELAMLEPHPPSLTPTLRRVLSAADRASRLAHQLLVLARVDGTAQTDSPLEAVDLAAVAVSCAEQWTPRALERDVDLGFDLKPAPTVGRGFLLQEMLSNLIDNAMKYAGARATVTVRTGLGDSWAWFEVEDDGPGVTDDERSRLLERFQRGKLAMAEGTGLGLAIVRDIAAMHGGHVELLGGTDQRGLRVRVSLPAR